MTEPAVYAHAQVATVGTAPDPGPDQDQEQNQDQDQEGHDNGMD